MWLSVIDCHVSQYPFHSISIYGFPFFFDFSFPIIIFTRYFSLSFLHDFHYIFCLVSFYLFLFFPYLFIYSFSLLIFAFSSSFFSSPFSLFPSPFLSFFFFLPLSFSRLHYFHLQYSFHVLHHVHVFAFITIFFSNFPSWSSSSS